ncbi:putative nuclease HARBI1 [Cucumis melo var. makuwa]|uniref:Putative nuclease HARBI1 n=1 Tax=Cucumis melo var. makuwa TaxID=1194695 RepID=A0A5D3C603_CUCMM|nr:putative nuclease HARBI1 [Cucumis melo var. makuwa]
MKEKPMVACRRKRKRRWKNGKESYGGKATVEMRQKAFKKRKNKCTGKPLQKMKYHVKNKDIWKFLDGIYFKKEKLELGGDQYKSHDVKNRVARRHFAKSGETVSRHFNVVLNAVLRLHEILLKQPNPVTHSCSHEKWQWFHNFLGALDGTHIKLNVSMSDRPRWEGYAFDSRVLRDAVSRPTGLKVPKGYYYLCDAGYPNAEGFLAP